MSAAASRPALAFPPFAVYPAIDLRGGRCVRLQQGDPAREEAFGDDPVAVARRWAAGGARALHVVDLDGAFAGEPRQMDLVAAVVAASGLPVQFGGGLRTQADLERAFAAGVARVVLGTRALDPAFLRESFARFRPERVAVALDARGRRVTVEGWRAEAGWDLGELAGRLRVAGALVAVFTQVERDGMLSGADAASVAELTARGLSVVASGGVSSAADVRILARAGAVGAIVGRALYTGRVALADLLRAEGDACRDGAAPGAARRRGPDGEAPRGA